jgi:hypothetical protein
MGVEEDSIGILVDRASRSLDAVLPYVDNHYARLQLRALGEMLRNVATRVEERADQREAKVKRTCVALDTLAELSGQPAAGPSKEPAELRAELAGTINQLYAENNAGWRDPALATVWLVVRADYDAEAHLIRTGMYSD